MGLYAANKFVSSRIVLQYNFNSIIANERVRDKARAMRFYLVWRDSEWAIVIGNERAAVTLKFQSYCLRIMKKSVTEHGRICNKQINQFVRSFIVFIFNSVTARKRVHKVRGMCLYIVYEEIMNEQLWSVIKEQQQSLVSVPLRTNHEDHIV